MLTFFSVLIVFGGAVVGLFNIIGFKESKATHTRLPLMTEGGSVRVSVTRTD